MIVLSDEFYREILNSREKRVFARRSPLRQRRFKTFEGYASTEFFNKFLVKDTGRSCCFCDCLVQVATTFDLCNIPVGGREVLCPTRH